jgi:hypothetical protein
MPEETAHGSPQNGNGHTTTSFSALARAHFDWDRGAEPESGHFQEALEAFEAASGRIVDAYWCRKDASAVALTLREQPRGAVRRLLSGDGTDYRLHRLSDWVTAGTRDVPDLLHDCDILAIKAANGLEGVPRAVVMQWLMAIEAHVLGFIERHRDAEPRPKELATFVRRQRTELRRIEAYYQEAGEKRARLRYVEGMLGIGILFVALAAVATWGLLALFGFGDLHDEGVREFYAATTAGALGAIISVLMRMSGRGDFAIDHELGRTGVLMVGAWRPLIGTVSGIVVYFLVQTPMLPLDDASLTVPFYVVIAFLAGFSERWTRMVLSGAMSTIAERGHQDEDAPAPSPPAAPEHAPSEAPASPTAAA